MSKSKFFQVDNLSLLFPWYGRMNLDLWRPLRQWVYNRDKGICQYCQNPVEFKSHHCHHIFELGSGGTNHPTNLKTSCISCHKIRHPFMKTANDRLREMAD